MKKICLLLFLAGWHLVGLAQNWKEGDKVEVYDRSSDKWENGTVSTVLHDRTPQQWRVKFDKQGHVFDEVTVQAREMRARGSKPAMVFPVNTMVDLYYADGNPHARGWVKEVLPEGRYKIALYGCEAYRDQVVDWSQVKPATTIPATAPEITSVFGNWAMFVYSYPNTYTDGRNVYRVYGTGAKAPPLQINANGTYTWYDEFNKPPVKGKWTIDAALPGATMGTEKENGIIIRDSRGQLWKVYKDRADHIEARVMCSGLTQGGTRLK